MEMTMKLGISERMGSLAGALGVLAMVLAAQASSAQQVAKGAPAVAAAPASSPVTTFEPAAFSALAPGAQQAAKPVNPEEEESAKPDKPGTQGIKVHGHWVMDIKNPDGTLVKHLDFQNSLVTGGGSGNNAFSTGDQLLAALLSGSGVISDPGILFAGFNPGLANFPANSDITNDCNFTSYSPSCQFFTTPQSLLSWNEGNGLSFGQAILSANAPGSANQMGLSTQVFFSPTVKWVLSGNWTVPTGFTSLTAVQTWLPLCYSTSGYSINYSLTGSTMDRTASAITIAGCAATTFGGSAAGDGPYALAGPFTSTLVPGAPQAITPGQIITVTVTISFS